MTFSNYSALDGQKKIPNVFTKRKVKNRIPKLKRGFYGLVPVGINADVGGGSDGGGGD